MSERKDVFRPFDYVEIVEPFRFVRCGYENDYVSVLDRLGREKRDEALKALQSLFGWSDYFVQQQFGGLGFSSLFEEQRTTSDERFRKVFLQAARIEAKRTAKSGSKRQVFEEELDPSLVGAQLKVMSKRNVQTGTYWAASGSEDGYEPAVLSVEKVHVVLEVVPALFMSDQREQVSKIHEILASRVRKVGREPGSPKVINRAG